MDILRTNATLPVSRILDSNPAWMREDIRELDDLKASLADHGMLLPVLLTNDWEVVDGARRVVAASQLGWKDVPVLIQPEWNTVVAYFKDATRRALLGQQAVPMTWLELADLWIGPLTRLYNVERLARMVETRKKRRSGEIPPSDNRPATTNISKHLAEMYGISESDVKSIRDIRSGLHRLKEVRPASKGTQLANQARTMIDRAYAQALQQDPGYPVSGLSFTRHVIQAIAGGRTTMAEGEENLNRFLEMRRDKPAPVRNPKPRATQRLAKPDTSTAAGRLVAMLVTVATEAEHFDFDVSPVTPEQAASLADLILQCSLKTNRFKRQLLAIAEDSTTQPNPTDSRSTTA